MTSIRHFAPAYCEIIERKFDAAGGSVVVYWHVFEASWYWDQVAGQMVYGQTRGYRYSDTPDTKYSKQDITRLHEEAIMLEDLRTGLSQRATQTV